MEDIMLIRSGFLRNLISKVINKALAKQMPGVDGAAERYSGELEREGPEDEGASGSRRRSDQGAAVGTAEEGGCAVTRIFQGAL